ncbi:hypothetical protein A5791_14465 [Mycobacterium sp. 852002-51163_SCH5372311]|uniref:hypothetical protein n=1 Tax=Mycobacterium sp. 852002-51163_SCH5372311 TaxID=1834097 RepID=UPI0007FDE840|nr:hypothetical protein [Mycobacterium sp. 852002-51163_SCH5372311]OBF92180.1 hypothetical protein A5791_14465 [Mycobacterium sp. 852002-51163_SCH5372311]
MILIALFLFCIFALIVFAVVTGIVVLAVRSGRMKPSAGPTSPGPGKARCPGSGNYGHGQHVANPFSGHKDFTDAHVRCGDCGKTVSCYNDGRAIEHYR